MTPDQENSEVAADLRVLTKNPQMISRLKSAVEAAGGRKAVAAKSGISLGTLNGALDDKTDVGFLKIAAIAQACGVTLDWIVNGSFQSGIPDAAPKSVPLGFQVFLPRFDARASAGPGQVPTGDVATDQMVFDRRFLAAIGASPSTCFVMTASGDSAWPTVDDGALIIVDRSHVAALDNGLYVLRVAEHIYLKRVQQLASGGLRLISDNAIYPPDEVSPADLANVQIIGRVVWPSSTPRRP